MPNPFSDRRPPRLLRFLALEMPEDCIDQVVLGDEGDHLHLRAAGRAHQRIDLVDPADHPRPAGTSARLALGEVARKDRESADLEDEAAELNAQAEEATAKVKEMLQKADKTQSEADAELEADEAE